MQEYYPYMCKYCQSSDHCPVNFLASEVSDHYKVLHYMYMPGPIVRSSLREPYMILYILLNRTLLPEICSTDVFV